MGVQKTQCLKTYELQRGMQDFTVDFIDANRRFDWVEILLVYDKSNKHLTIYDNYNAESAARLIKSLEFTNISKEYNATNTLRFNISNDLQKHLLYKQFFAWHTNRCSVAPVTDFIVNLIAQELPDEEKYYGDNSDEKVYVDLRDSKGYTNELKKPSQNDSKMTINIELKNPFKKKDETSGVGLYKQRISVYAPRRCINIEIQNIHNKVTICRT